MIHVYSTRAIRCEFIQRYSENVGIKLAILRDVWRYVTGDSAASESSAISEVDQRVADFLLNSADTDLIYDLRHNNGHPCDKKFDPFWEELGRYLDEKSVVDERKQEQHMFLPFAISVEDLRDIIAKRLLSDAEIPSKSWLLFQFWPSNPYAKCAAQYSGRYNVKFAVQQRLVGAQLRMPHTVQSNSDT
jgi:hypothetical protein